MSLAMKLSEGIRMKRKKMKEEGLENAIDTSPAPQMNAQDIMDLKQRAQWEDTLDVPEKSEAPSDPADPSLDESQTESGLKKKMSRLSKYFGTLRPSR